MVSFDGHINMVIRNAYSIIPIPFLCLANIVFIVAAYDYMILTSVFMPHVSSFGQILYFYFFFFQEHVRRLQYFKFIILLVRINLLFLHCFVPFSLCSLLFCMF